jgi:glycosyltransferase involved in cell wall biosynthesis
MKLSILIATIPERQKQLERLMARLRPQIPDTYDADGNLEVEVIVHEELANKDGGPTIGENRQALLESATGDYVCFIDDDDFVTEDYVAQILKAIDTPAPGINQPDTESQEDYRKRAQPDCIGIKGHYYDSPGREIPQLMFHSKRFEKWAAMLPVFERTPNHINPARRELALQVGYQDLMAGEDHKYSNRLHPLLKTEVMIEKPIYIYLDGGEWEQVPPYYEQEIKYPG